MNPIEQLRLSLVSHELATFVKGNYPIDSILNLLDENPRLMSFDCIPGKPETTPLTLAIEYQNWPLATLLLQRGAVPVDRAVVEATKLGRLDVVRALKEKGASLFNTALGEASGRGDLELVRYLVKSGAPVELGDRYGATPLIRSCWAKRFDVVRFLLCEAGASPLTRAKSGESPLLALLRDSKCSDAELMADTVRLLLDKGADPDACDKTYLRAPLHVVETGEVATLLLQSGANREAVEYTHLSPLGTAVENGSLGVIKVLLEHGASVVHQDELGNTPLHLLPNSKNLSVSGKIEAARMLLSFGADPTIPNRASQTPRSVLTRSLRFIHPDLPALHALLKEAEDTLSLVRDLFRIRLISLQDGVLANRQGLPPAIMDLLDRREKLPRIEFLKVNNLGSVGLGERDPSSDGGDVDGSSSSSGSDRGSSSEGQEGMETVSEVLQAVASWQNDGHFIELIGYISPYYSLHPKGIFQ